MNNLENIKLSIIVPAYNEIDTIGQILDKLKTVGLGPNIAREIIVVDDGSKDGTRDFLAAYPGIKYIFHEHNLGKGGAVKTGFREATGDILTIQDADLEYDPSDFAEIIRPIIDGKTEMVLGVRISPERDYRRRKSLYWISWFGNKIITWMTNLLYWNNAEEYEGCYKAFTRGLVRSIEVRTNGFDFDNELVCKALRKGYKSIDVPIKYYPRSYDEGKKIGWKDGFKILKSIARCRFGD